MSADAALILIFGLSFGFGMGYLHAWRLARKLEHHEVVLAEWDQHYDPQAEKPRAGTVHELSKAR